MESNSTFTHLHTHSCYSFLDGILSPEQLAKQARDFNMESIALTDHHGLTGAVVFYDACHENGIKPILGLELVNQHAFGKGSLVILCMNLNGWSNLCQISSIIQCCEDRDYSTGVRLEPIAKNAEGLICLTGGKRGLLNHLLENGQTNDAKSYLGQLWDIFGKNVYIELQYQEPKDAASIDRLIDTGDSFDIQVVATNNVHYLTPEQSRLHRTLCAMRLNSTVNLLPDDIPAPQGSFFSSQDQMIKSFNSYPDAITNTQVIVDHCNLELPIGTPHYPEIDLPAGVSDNDLLRELAEDGAKKKYGNVPAQIQQRLDHELKVIEERGYAPLFIIVQDILDFARTSNVPISSRGSAASSLVAYCLGITSPDPIALNLYFERFLNPARSSPPDIDTDLCSRRRHKVIEYVYEHYGEDQVAMVATINSFQLRSALREVSKAHGLTTSEINNLTESLPYRRRGPSSRSGSDSGNPYESLYADFPGRKFMAIFHDAAKVIGLPRHLSIHPGGIVISPNRMTELVPTHLASKGIYITQFDLKSIERIGLVKIDLLGTRGLTVLGDVAEQVQQWRPTEYSNSLEVLESIPTNDSSARELLKSTRVVGCFAIESPGMRDTLRQIHASSIDDIMIALALYRPGPMTGGLKDAFIQRHLGLEPVRYLHASLEPLLKNTYGVILYQEQVLRIASELAGLSLSDADLLRRAMSHFDPGDRMRTLKLRFMKGALEKSRVPEAIGEQIWELMAAFAGYGFPKAHAASYAQVAWQSIWCKTHFPAEFMAAVLAGGGGYYRQYVYINEARRIGIPIRAPHINHSQRKFSTSYRDGTPTLYMGLDQVRDLTSSTQYRIMAERPFTTLDEFLTRVDPRLKEAENLISAGCLSGIGTIPGLLSQIQSAGWRKSQPRLFKDGPDKRFDEWDVLQRVEFQRNILGVGMDAHPVDLVREKAESLGVTHLKDVPNRLDAAIHVVGIRQTLQRFRSPEGEVYYILELDDGTDIIPVRITEYEHQKNHAIFSHITPFIVEGRMVEDKQTGMTLIYATRCYSIQ